MRGVYQREGPPVPGRGKAAEIPRPEAVRDTRRDDVPLEQHLPEAHQVRDRFVVRILPIGFNFSYTSSILLRDLNRVDPLRQYFSQLRAETSLRLIEKLYGSDKLPNKWWLCFSRRKFMNITSAGTL